MGLSNPCRGYSALVLLSSIGGLLLRYTKTSRGRTALPAPIEANGNGGFRHHDGNEQRPWFSLLDQADDWFASDQAAMDVDLTGTG